MAPATATSRLYRFRPVTPPAPRRLNTHPPAIAPTIPSTISRRKPSPRLLTILLPMKPANRPNRIQLRKGIVQPPHVKDDARQGLLIHAYGLRADRRSSDR